MISEISGGQGQNKNLSSRISSLDEQVVKQQELLYNVEFQLQQMERKAGVQMFGEPPSHMGIGLFLLRCAQIVLFAMRAHDAASLLSLAAPMTTSAFRLSHF